MSNSAPLWVSTTTIANPFTPLGIVTFLHWAPRPAFAELDLNAAYRAAVAGLADEARRLNGNGVIGICFDERPNDLGVHVLATGTAVSVAT